MSSRVPQKPRHTRSLAGLLCRLHHPVVRVSSLFSTHLPEPTRKSRQQVTAVDRSGISLAGVFPGASRHAGQSQSDAAANKPLMPMNIVMGEEVLSPARVKEDLEGIRRETGADTLQPNCHTHCLHPDGPRRPGHQPARGGLLSLRLCHAQPGIHAHAAPDGRVSRADSPYDLRIEGHTDNVPIHNAEFDSNWELSSARATRIARIFLEMNAIPADRLSAAGYAEFHPVAGNDTPEGRAENRRVDLVVLPRTNINFSEPITPPVARCRGERSPTSRR